MRLAHESVRDVCGDLEATILASDDAKQVSVTIGDECDEALRKSLMDTLRSLGGVQIGSGDRGVAGSQELQRIGVDIGGRALWIDAETYIGLSIVGPADLVERVRVHLKQ